MSPYRDRSVLVTGGLGFVGSHVVEALLVEGARVAVFDARIPGLGGTQARIPEALRDSLVEADLRDTPTVAAALRGVEVVFHLAGATGHARSMVAPVADLSLNVEATASLLSACVEHAPDARVVFASTRQIYGRATGPLDETHPIVPVDVNGVGKRACEELLRVYEGRGLRGVSLRLTNVYGPRMSLDPGRGHVLGAFLRRALRAEVLDVFRPGTDRRSFLHAADAASAFLLAGVTDACLGRRLNVAGSAPRSIRELADILARLGGVDVREVDFPDSLRTIDVGDHALDDGAFRALTGWRPAIELEAGLATTLAAFRSEAP
ncbi:MAG: NAD-dependent epimerase/dehydratase family protein [Sandaracinaceae bacterium]